MPGLPRRRALRATTRLSLPRPPRPAVFVTKVDPSYAQPWQKLPQRSSSGSAFVLDSGRRLLITNAHVVRPGPRGLLAAGERTCLCPHHCAGSHGPSAQAHARHGSKHLAFAAVPCPDRPPRQVANAVTVYVRRPGDPRKTKATVACMARQVRAAPQPAAQALRRSSCVLHRQPEAPAALQTARVLHARTTCAYVDALSPRARAV